MRVQNNTSGVQKNKTKQKPTKTLIIQQQKDYHNIKNE